MSEQPPFSSDPQGSYSQRPGQGEPALSESAMAPEISRRVSSVLDAVEREATRLREEALEEARRYLDYSRRRADSLVDERQRRISDLSDEILRKSEAVLARLDAAGPVREGFENLVRSLGGAAERLARESEETADRFKPPEFHDPAAQSHEPAGSQQYPSGPGAGSGAAQSPSASNQAPSMPHPARTPEQPAPVPHSESAAQGPPAPASPTPDPLADARTVAIQMAAAGNTRAQVRQHLQSAMGLTDTCRVLDDVFGQGSSDDARVPWASLGSWDLRGPPGPQR